MIINGVEMDGSTNAAQLLTSPQWVTGHGSSVTPYGVVMAGALISALPLLIVFFFVQKRFVEGIAMTGMK